MPKSLPQDCLTNMNSMVPCLPQPTITASCVNVSLYSSDEFSCHLRFKCMHLAAAVWGLPKACPRPASSKRRQRASVQQRARRPFSQPVRNVDFGDLLAAGAGGKDGGCAAAVGAHAGVVGPCVRCAGPSRPPPPPPAPAAGPFVVSSRVRRRAVVER